MTFVTIFRREVRSLVAAPQTYAIAGGYLLISGIFFVNLLISTQVPDITRYFSNVATTLVVLVPIVAMRSFAEERKAGQLDLTLSWPISRVGLVLGKFAANTLFAWVLISIVWVYVRIISSLASIEVARAAGGYIGMLLLAMAFGALALMVSARSSTPTGAAFTGFGLLLVLWILEFAPGWLGDTLGSIAPSVRFESFPRGVVYLEDLAYFFLVTVVGLGMAVQTLSRNGPGRVITSRVRRAAVLGAALSVLMGTPAVARQVEGQIDLTDARRNTVSPATRDLIRQVEETIRVTAFIRPISAEAVQFRDVVKRYRNAGASIKVETVDPDTQPGRARRAGVTEYNKYIFEIGDRREVIDNLSEISVTSVISRLARPDRPRACFTIGHGEREISNPHPDGLTTFAEHLGRLPYEVAPLALAGDGGQETLETCQVVLVVGPKVPFLPGELQMLKSYAANDGRLVVLADGLAGSQDDVNALLRPWGMRFAPEVVHDRSSIADDPTSVVSFDYRTKNPIVARLADENVPVVSTNGVAVQFAEDHAGESGGSEDDRYVIELVGSSRESWVETPNGRQAGPFVLAAVADATAVDKRAGAPSMRRARIGVVGSAEMVTNRFFDLVGNRDMLTKLVQWVGEETDLITAHRDPLGFYKLILTRDQRDEVIRRAIAYPVLAALFPLPVALFRLKRG